MKEFLAFGAGWIALAIGISLLVWYTVIFYIVVPAIAKLKEMGVF